MKCILIVDDDPKISAALEIRFRAGGYRTLTAGDAARGLSRAVEERPDLILLDVSMPGYDRGDIANHLSLDPELSAMPIMFFTSLISQSEAGGRVVEKAGQRFLAKPLNPDVLVREVDRSFAETLN